MKYHLSHPDLPWHSYTQLLQQSIVRNCAELNAAIFCSALLHQKISVIQTLLAWGVNPNECVISRHSALVFASAYGDLSILQMLLDAGAAAHPGDALTPLNAVICSRDCTKKPERVDMLVQAGATDTTTSLAVYHHLKNKTLDEIHACARIARACRWSYVRCAWLYACK